jgi:hypothetical protein
MTSFRQIEANRRNAIKSTGPTTEEGKHRSRQNAVQHGLCAETVVEIVEDIDDYRSFEAAIIADYDARTAVERELVLRLVSLLWRLRRATAIETDLLRIQAEIVRDRRQNQAEKASNNRTSHLLAAVDDAQRNENQSKTWRADRFDHHEAIQPASQSPLESVRQLNLCFQRIAHLDNEVFERLGRYESSIARQVIKIIFLLRSIHHRI